MAVNNNERLERWRTMKVRRPGARASVVLVNRKGGSAKTTSAVQLAAILAAWGLRVRLIDGDPQRASCTFWLPPQAQGPTLREVFFGEASVQEAMAPTSVPGLWIVPSDKTLGQVDLARPAGAELILKSEIDGDESVDVDILDAAGAMGAVTVAMMAAASHLLLVIKNSGLDFVGQADIKEPLDLVQKRLNPDLDVTAAVLADTDANTTLSRKLGAQLTEDYPRAMLHVIPHSVRAAEAPLAHQPLIMFAPDNAVTLAYWDLAEKLLPRLGLEVVG